MALCNTHANSREAARLNTAGCKLNTWVWTPRFQDDASSHVPVDRCGAAVTVERLHLAKDPQPRMAKTDDCVPIAMSGSSVEQLAKG